MIIFTKMNIIMMALTMKMMLIVMIITMDQGISTTITEIIITGKNNLK